MIACNEIGKYFEAIYHLTPEIQKSIRVINTFNISMQIHKPIY